MRWSVLLAMVAASVSGCSVVVGGSLDGPLRCEADGADDPCPPPLRCVQGLCREEACSTETCNGRDDDCDGQVDNVDFDGDGFFACEDAGSPLDCDDTNPSVHPAWPDRGRAAPAEVCDGIDNDCSGGIDDVEMICRGDEICIPSRGGCLRIDCSVLPSVCSDTQFCDTSTGAPACRERVRDCRTQPEARCVSPERCDPSSGQCVMPRPVGQGCSTDLECVTDLCVRNEATRLTFEESGGLPGVCSRACCRDSDCDPDAVCWAPGTAARVCLPRALLARGSGPPSVRWCNAEAHCSSSERCTIRQDSAFVLSNRVSLACGPALGDLPAGWFCLDGSWCESGICWGNECRRACARSDECPQRCGYLTSASEGRDHWVPLCIEGGGSPAGAACSSNNDCIDRACIGNVCAASCCNDSQCPSQDLQCRPTFVNGRWEPHCLPRTGSSEGGGIAAP